MADYVGNVSTKGQVTLPAELRAKLGIKPGDRVVMSPSGDGIVVRASRSKLLDSYMSIPALKKPMSLKELKEIATEEAAREHLGLRDIEL